MAVAQYKINHLNKKFQELSARFKKDKIWNDMLQIEGIDATESVFHAHIHDFFYESICKMKSGVNKEAVEKLRTIYAASEMEKYDGVLIFCGVKGEDLELIHQGMIEALSFTRKHALGLIEAFEIRDEALHSILGRKDGNVYEHMLNEAKNKNPINKEKVFPGITSYLRPKI